MPLIYPTQKSLVSISCGVVVSLRHTSLQGSIPCIVGPTAVATPASQAVAATHRSNSPRLPSHPPGGVRCYRCTSVPSSRCRHRQQASTSEWGYPTNRWASLLMTTTHLCCRSTARNRKMKRDEGVSGVGGCDRPPVGGTGCWRSPRGKWGSRRGCLDLKRNDLYGLGVIQNCQHYQKRTQTTLFCDPLSPKRVLWKCWFLTTHTKMQCIIINIFKNRTVAIDPPPPLCTLVKMVTILVDPLVPQSITCNKLYSEWRRQLIESSLSVVGMNRQKCIHLM